MLILLYGSVLAWSMAKVPWWPKCVLTQFSHPWGTYTLFDVIQPLFAVVCGAAVPLALARRLNGGRADGAYWKHVLGRFVQLYFLGACFCGLQKLDLTSLLFFGNTLQLLGFGYLFAAACYAWVPRKSWPWIIAVLLAAWGVALHWGGGLTPESNLGIRIERGIASVFLSADAVAATKRVTWAIVPMFCALTLLGAYVIGFVCDVSVSAIRRANGLLFVGLTLLALGIGVRFVQPEIKQLYTPAYTLISAGISLVLFGIFFWLFDIWNVRRGTWLFLLYGRAALASYVLWSFFARYYMGAASGILEHVNRAFVPAEVWPLVDACGALFLSTSVLWLWCHRKGKTNDKV